MNNETISSVIATLAQRIAGLQEYGPQLGPQILIEGQAYTLAQLIAVFQDGVTDRAQAAATKVALQAVMVQKAKNDAIRKVVDEGLKVALVGKFGSNSKEVTACGYVKAAKKLTVKVKAEAVEQAAGTRKVLHTMGSNQKKVAKKQAAAQAAAAPPAPSAGPTPPTTPNAATPGTTPTK